MSNLRVVALLRAKPGSEDALGDALKGLVEPTRAEEGCLSYDLFTSNVDPTTFVTIEEWRSQADLDAHMQTPHIGAALASAGDIFSAAPEIHPLTQAHD
jgi:quinol monooxygenase YgiN